MNKKILVIGACGQIGVELTVALRNKYGNKNVVACDIRDEHDLLKGTGPFAILDVQSVEATHTLVKREGITEIYLLAALLSATGEKNPKLAWDLNIGSLRQILDLAVKESIKLFWPSSIAVFGPTTPQSNTEQRTIVEPTTMYGITKYAGELLCQYYHKRLGLDVRSVRYPGLISWKSKPGGGTTDYAVEIYYEALERGKYTCFLSENTYLPMMYMDDAIRATIELMEAPPEKVKNRMAYNLSSMSFSPREVAEEIKKHIPNFEISYVAEDPRQSIADGWPKSIDDKEARANWGWKHEFDLAKMTEAMLSNLKVKLSSENTQLKIRTFEPSDKKDAYDLHVKALAAAGTYMSGGNWDDDFKDIKSIYIKSGGEFLVGIMDNKIVAMGALKKISEDMAEVKRMRVDPEFQRHGFGHAVLEKLESRALELGFKSLQLDVAVTQEAACKFYEKNGYKEFKREPMGDLVCIFYKKML
jgi:nucleoside-diphosphate-sugar epimerase/ribosomal protein S18 acetylase RimI-like enzyme